MRKTRSNYWSCSDFADKIRKLTGVTTKPKVATMPEWRLWKQRNKQLFGYWVTDTLLDRIQDVIMWPSDLLREVRAYYRNRFVTKTHYLSTGLKPGEWHELDQRILHGLFESFVDFIEVEKAYMNQWSDKFTKQPFWHRFWFLRWNEFRSPADGLAYLQWEMSLEDETTQKESATEQYELYNWWKNIRPARPDPYDESGWTDAITGKDMDDLFCSPITDEARAALAKCNELEQKYEEEDTEMLIRLIKIRRHLWT